MNLLVKIDFGDGLDKVDNGDAANDAKDLCISGVDGDVNGDIGDANGDTDLCGVDGDDNDDADFEEFLLILIVVIEPDLLEL